MRSAGLAIIAGTVLWLTSSGALAHPEDYSPFEKGQEPKPFPVRECVTLEELAPVPDAAFAPVIVGIKGSKDAPRLRLTPAEGVPGVVVTVLDAGGKTLAGPWYADLYWPGRVRHADLNADGREDFVVQLEFAGCGLQSAFSQLVFVVSSADGYAFSTVNTYFARDADFVDLGDGRCRHVQASMVYGDSETAADGRRHNYWVHTLLAFGKDGRAVVDNSADKRFPAWIWYTEKPNHQPTRLLTEEQKRRLWAREPRVFGARDRGDARARPDFEAGATEACNSVVGPRVHHPSDWQVYAGPIKSEAEFGLFVRRGDKGPARQLLTSCRVVETHWAISGERWYLVINDAFVSSDERCFVHDLAKERTWRIDGPARKRFESLAPAGKGFDHLYVSTQAVSPDATKVLLGACGHGAGSLKAARTYVVSIDTGEVLAEYKEAQAVPLKWW